MEHSSKSINGDEDRGTNATPKQCWKGATMEEIHRHLNEFELDHVPPVKPSDHHTVLYKYPIKVGDNQPPIPYRAHAKWDSMHVRLPCSEKSQYPVSLSDGTSSIEPRWEMIEKALLKPIANSQELQEAILSYNTRYANQWNFRALHKLFKDDLDESESRVFFEDLLPRIIRLALRLPDLIEAPIPLLKQGQNHSLSLTQEQVSCLLANAFLCTFPRRNTLKRKSEYSTFPDINFNRLFQSSGQSVIEKIKCICHYFRRVCPTEQDSDNVPTGVVTFTRRSLSPEEFPNWDSSKTPIGETLLHITSEGTIEDQGLGLLQVDFANKFLGGGVLGAGCVQEEIRFVICPELLISKLFTECLKPNEALLMVGAERFSDYAGYASSFEWSSNHEDNTPRDSSRRRMTHVVAIDALSFVQSSHQFRADLMLRELNKAYVGFYHPLSTAAPGVASGNWGCGAFGGDAKLKALLQLIVCTEAKRPLVYYTFGNAELRDEVFEMHSFLKEENITVEELWNVLKTYSQRDSNDLYTFIQKEIRKRRTKTVAQNPTKPMNGSTVTQSSCGNSQAPAVAEKQTPKEAPKKQDKQNISLLLFETDSDEDNQTKEDEDDKVTSRKSSPMAASPDKSPTVDKEAPSLSNKPRQRTLLDMLEQAYTGADQHPASKRICIDKSNQN